MDSDIAIRVEHLSKDFVLPHEKITSIKSAFTHVNRLGKSRRVRETQHALKDVSLEIKKGEFFGIVGRNGSGKSTLLKILAGIYQPTKGKVTVDGKLVPFIELGVGFNPELTGRENVYLNGAMMGFSRKEVSAMYDDIVEFAELERFMDQKLKNYSSGMQVRLAFSMATRAKADILLVDEVLAVGDADFQRKCFTYFYELKLQKKTVVFVSHDMDAIREYCDQAALIEENCMVDVGKTSKIAEGYAKLFNSKAPVALKQGDETDRWGNGDLKIEKMAVDVNDESITIHHTIVASRDTVDPIIGFRIRNSEGRSVLGTNTKVEEQSVGVIKSGEKLSVAWRFDNVLSDGRYFVDPAIVARDGITVMDWWDGAIAFDARRGRHLPYDVDLVYVLKHERENAV